VLKREFPQSESELLPAERAAVRRARLRWLQGSAALVGLGALSVLAIGCPGAADLQNPCDYPTTAQPNGTAGAAAKPPPCGTAPIATGGGSGGGGNTPNACEVACVNDIFQTQPALCKLCHNNSQPNPLKSSMLDLSSPGYTARLKDVPAVHGDLPAGKTTCTPGDKLIDSANPDASWLKKKIEGMQGQCGDPMPSAGMLTADQKACLETYITCVAGGSGSMGGSGGTGGMPSSGGGGAGGASAGTGGASGGGMGGAAGGTAGTGGNGGMGGQ
jgi:hypothetical protein